MSEGEYDAVKLTVPRWAERAGYLSRLEVLGFVDWQTSLNWIKSAGCKVMNLLCKGSFKHVTEQLRKTPEQHIADITEVGNGRRRWGLKLMFTSKTGPTVCHSPEYLSVDGRIERPSLSSVSCCPIRWVFSIHATPTTSSVRRCSPVGRNSISTFTHNEYDHWR